ncbi:Helix-turn-helix domain protein [uncultured Eubacteriales bacterium]|uniref:Helix-turn-helix domain protein n=1 Tax=uncultured Eubacteriales bacterium TaxID=172733 RepID=A0A212JIA4_9FIRM|nr:Helix-turn-helix domain protein [uncultured Eubacteriales bacterium]
MEWTLIGQRVRKQREFLGYTREQLAEQLDVTPKFCSDIELGLKGMSVPTLCRISEVLHLSTDYILFGTEEANDVSATTRMLQQCPPNKLHYIESILKMFLLAIDDKRD